MTTPTYSIDQLQEILRVKENLWHFIYESERAMRNVYTSNKNFDLDVSKFIYLSHDELLLLSAIFKQNVFNGDFGTKLDLLKKLNLIKIDISIDLTPLYLSTLYEFFKSKFGNSFILDIKETHVGLDLKLNVYYLGKTISASLYESLKTL